jgi:hypothetical protein
MKPIANTDGNASPKFAMSKLWSERESSQSSEASSSTEEPKVVSVLVPAFLPLKDCSQLNFSSMTGKLEMPSLSAPEFMARGAVARVMLWNFHEERGLLSDINSRCAIGSSLPRPPGDQIVEVASVSFNLGFFFRIGT